jgi:alpha-glucosidase
VLGNHDRSRIATRVGPAQARVAAMLLLTLRGTPILYYGDEIGMADVPVPTHLAQDPYELRVPGLGVGRDPERSPMQWSPDVHAGFCPPWTTPWLPVPDARLNVAAQRDDPGSMLSLYRQLIALRRAEPALSIGDYELVVADAGLLAYRRRYEHRRLLVALNLGDAPGRLPVTGGPVVLGTHPDRAGQPVSGPLTLRGNEGVIMNS